MRWIEPKRGKGEIDRAGQDLVYIQDDPYFFDAATEEIWHEALNVVGNWRSSHARALQTIYMILRNRARKVDPDALVVQRLKRMESIISKLGREENMKLSQMQDLGGCRAVVVGVEELRELVSRYEKSNQRTSGQEFTKRFDYVTRPKPNGYRSIHYVYKYRSMREHLQPFVGQRIEVLIRTQNEHSWATAVETVSTFTDQSLKANIGEEE